MSISSRILISRLFVIGGFLLFVSLAFIFYSPILSLPYFLDDFHNLSPFSVVHTYDDFLNIFQAVLSNTSGPLGRPVSMVSFLISDFTWPSPPEGHRFVNVAIHALNSVLVFWLVHRIGYRLAVKEQVFWFSLLAASLWVLSPLHSNVIFSVIQRMTSLSAFFGLLSLHVFLVFQDAVFKSKYVNSILSFLLFFALVSISTLCKESGFLFFGYALILAWVFRPASSRLSLKAYVCSIKLLALLYFVFLLILNARYILEPSVWAGRDFSALQRLSAEILILADYIKSALFIDYPGFGLIRGDEPLAHWYQAEYVSWAILLSAVLLFLVYRYRDLTVLSLLWFLNGHAIESFGLPLELYFEHRNYIAILPVYVSISHWLIVNFRSNKVISAVVGVTTFALILIFKLNLSLYNDPLSAAYHVASEYPDSPRAVSQLSQTYLSLGDVEAAYRVLKESEIGKLQYQAEIVLCGIEKDHRHQLVWPNEDVVGIEVLSYVKSLRAMSIAGACQINNASLIDYIESLLEGVSASNKIKALLSFEKALIYVEDGNLQGTIDSVDLSIEYYNLAEFHYTRAYWLYTAGLYDLSLDAIESGLRAPSKCRLIRYPCDVKLIKLRSQIKKTL